MTATVSRPNGIEQDAAESAKDAGLRYVRDDQPGIQRVKRGRGVIYVDADGNRIRDDATISRITSLAIPPAWTDVWICPSPRGHLQATGRDDRGRKQYRYHPRWREVRDEAKYDRMIPFAETLPTVRARASADLAKPGTPREKVLAVVVRLLEDTLIRIGNEEYVRENGSFGLTTLRNRHVDIDGSQISFEFKGKGGKLHSVDVRDVRLARVISRLRAIPGQELFQYLDEEGTRHPIDSDAVNAYLREISGDDFTAKDFRTWAGTVLAAMELLKHSSAESERQATANVVAAIEMVAARLGNTPTICRRCYVHPAVIDAYLDGSLCNRITVPARTKNGSLSPEEAAVLRFLKRQSRAGPKSSSR